MDLNSDPAISGTAKLSGASISNSNALRGMLHGRALHSTPAVDFVVIEAGEVKDDFSTLFNSYSFQRSEKG